MIRATLAVLALAACATQAQQDAVNSRATQLATDVELIDAAMSAALPIMAKDGTLPPWIVGQMTADLATLQLDTVAVRQAIAANQAVPADRVREIATLASTIATTALPLVPGGSALVPVLQAAQVLAPAVIAVVNPAVAPPAQAAQAARQTLSGAGS